MSGCRRSGSSFRGGGVAVPVAYLLAFHADLGTPGLMWGFLVGAIVSCIGLVIRFTLVSRRAIRRY